MQKTGFNAPKSTPFLLMFYRRISEGTPKGERCNRRVNAEYEYVANGGVSYRNENLTIMHEVFRRINR